MACIPLHLPRQVVNNAGLRGQAARILLSLILSATTAAQVVTTQPASNASPATRPPSAVIVAREANRLAQSAPSTPQSQPASQKIEIRAQQATWPMFRGDRELSGVAACVLPDKLDLKWKFKAGDVVASSAAIADGVAFVGSDDGFVYALSVNDGRVKWKFNAGAPVQAPPTVIGDRVYVGDQNGRFFALTAADGAELWRVATEGEILGGANFDRDRLYFGSYDGLIRCIGTDGRVIWTFKTESKVHATPAIVSRAGEERLLIAGCDGWLRSLALDDGRELGKVSLDSNVGASSAVLGDRAYMGTFADEFLCVDWKVEERVWVYQHPVRKFPYLSCAAVTPTRLIVGGRDKMVHGIEPGTGKGIWEYSTGARIEGSPVISGRNVWVGGGDGTIYAFDVETGRKVWEYAGCGPISASPAIAAGCLVIGDADGAIMCFAGR